MDRLQLPRALVAENQSKNLEFFIFYYFLSDFIFEFILSSVTKF
jgi:hypothetical protein